MYPDFIAEDPFLNNLILYVCILCINVVQESKNLSIVGLCVKKKVENEIGLAFGSTRHPVIASV